MYLDSSNIIESFVAASPSEICQEHFDDLVQIHSLGINDPIHLMEYLASETIRYKVSPYIMAFVFVEYSVSSECVTLEMIRQLFHNKIIDPSFLKRIRGKVASFVDCPEQVTRENAGYYWGMLEYGLSPEAAKVLCSEKGVVLPELVDTFAACTSFPALRERFGRSSDVVGNIVAFHVPFYSVFNGKKVDYPDDAFVEPIDVHDNNVKLQFDGAWKKTVVNSHAKWLMLDLYSFVAPRRYKYRGFDYIDFNGRVSNRIGAVKINSWLEEILDKKESIEKSIYAMRNSIITLKEKYGDRIIMISTYHSTMWIGDDDVIYRWNDEVLKEVSRRNEFFSNAIPILKDILDPYIIDFNNVFISDHMGYMGKAEMHFELEYYIAINRCIRYIIDNQPSDKCFYQCPSDLKIQRMLRLREKNPWWVLKKLFPSALDYVVLHLPTDYIEKNKMEISNWYDENKTIEMIRENANEKAVFEAIFLSEKSSEINSEHSIRDLQYEYV